MKIQRVELRIVPVRGKTKVYALSRLTMGVDSFLSLTEMVHIWMRQMDRQQRKAKR